MGGPIDATVPSVALWTGSPGRRCDAPQCEALALLINAAAAAFDLDLLCLLGAHRSEIMFGVLVVVLCRDCIAILSLSTASAKYRS